MDSYEHNYTLTMMMSSNFYEYWNVWFLIDLICNKALERDIFSPESCIFVKVEKGYSFQLLFYRRVEKYI